MNPIIGHIVLALAMLGLVGLGGHVFVETWRSRSYMSLLELLVDTAVGCMILVGALWGLVVIGRVLLR